MKNPARSSGICLSVLTGLLLATLGNGAFLSAAASIIPMGAGAGVIGAIEGGEVSTPAPNNEEVAGVNSNAFAILSNVGAGAGAAEYRVFVESSSGTTEYRIDVVGRNFSSQPIRGMRLEMGFGRGADFVVSTPDDSLDFDGPSFQPEAESDVFGLVQQFEDPDAIVFTEGSHPSGTGEFYRVSFSVDVPDPTPPMPDEAVDIDPETGEPTAYSFVLRIVPDFEARAPDPSTPGPLEVSSTEYRFADQSDVDASGDGLIELEGPVDVAGKVWYPTDASAGSHPLVLVVHGRRLGASTSYLGFDYLARRLASWGMIVVSIDANDTLAGGDLETITDTARLAQAHLRCWSAWAGGAAGPAHCDDPALGSLFGGRIDPTRVGLIGHSRSGQAVRETYNLVRSDGSAFDIRAVAELAPTDTTPPGVTPTDVADVAWMVLLGGCDGELGDLPGMKVFDRVQQLGEPLRPSPKIQKVLLGANHAYFNSEWSAEPLAANACMNQARLTRGQQQQAALVFLTGFYRTVLSGDFFPGLLTGDREPPLSVDAEIESAYALSGEAIFLVDDFSLPGSPHVNSAGGANDWPPGELSVVACDNDPTKPLNEPTRCPGVNPSFDGLTAWGHDRDKHAAKIVWTMGPASPPSLVLGVSPSGQSRDVSKYSVLSFRAAVQNDDLNPADPLGQNFTVRLASGGWASESIDVAEFAHLGRPLFLPGELGGSSTTPYAILETVRIPLAAFSLVDLAALTSVEFVFDREPQGAIYLSDVAFSDVAGDLTTYDGVVDRDDLQVVIGALGHKVDPGDPRDLDNDGRITVLDARQLVLMCTRPRCF